MLDPYPFQLFANPRSGTPGIVVLPEAGFRRAKAEITSWPGYAPTPLVDLPAIAHDAGLAVVRLKDESSRFGLGSFKALGGAYAVARLLCAELARRGVADRATSKDLVDGKHAGATERITVTCATDGNHGRSVAAGAAMFGCRSVILIHAGVSEAREQAIAARGAQVIRIDGNYDDTVRAAYRMAAQDGWALIADTSGHGGEGACADVMHGYTVMVAEALEQVSGLGQEPPSHIFVQGGVGGLAATACAYSWLMLAERAPIVVVVEPERADCLYQSAKAGRPTRATGDLNTVMACLSCGEVSEYAWRILSEGAEFFQTITDSEGIAVMRLLADEGRAGARIVAGESAGAGLAGLIAAATDQQARRTLRLEPSSRILVFGTEGATDPELYAALLAHPAVSV